MSNRSGMFGVVGPIKKSVASFRAGAVSPLVEGRPLTYELKHIYHNRLFQHQHAFYMVDTTMYCRNNVFVTYTIELDSSVRRDIDVFVESIFFAIRMAAVRECCVDTKAMKWLFPRLKGFRVCFLPTVT